MASVAQITSNQANALHSTGPRTAEGKARAAQNSRSHGFTAQTLHVPAGEREEFEQFHQALLRDTRPEGALEKEFFSRLLTYGWNLRRVRAAECKLLNETDPINNEDDARRLDRLARYRRGLERSHDRALAELRRLQTQRAILLQQHSSVIAAVYSYAPQADLARITNSTDPFIAQASDPLTHFDGAPFFSSNRAGATRRYLKELRTASGDEQNEAKEAA